MSGNRLALGSATLLAAVLMATPALAGHGHGGGHASGFGNAEKHGEGHPSGSSSWETHGNKHGEVRSLERANDVAGAHGEKGRTGAATHQSEHGHSHGDSGTE